MRKEWFVVLVFGVIFLFSVSYVSAGFGISPALQNIEDPVETVGVDWYVPDLWGTPEGELQLIGPGKDGPIRKVIELNGDVRKGKLVLNYDPVIDQGGGEYFLKLISEIGGNKIISTIGTKIYFLFFVPEDNSSSSGGSSSGGGGSHAVLVSNTCYSENDTRSAAVILHRKHLNCKDDSPYEIAMKGLDEQHIVINSERRQYCNFVCEDRKQQQCYDDGSFDTYYQEWCEDAYGRKIDFGESNYWDDSGYDCYSDYDCSYGETCVSGYCKREVEENVSSCEIEDGSFYNLGIDHWRKGVLKGKLNGVYGSYEDYCDGDLLVEYGCDRESDSIYEFNFECPNGCEDGACYNENGLFRIADISEVDPSYSIKEKISFEVKGVDSDGTPASREKGFNVQFYTYDVNDLDNPLGYYSQQGIYNANYNSESGYWDVDYYAPLSEGKYVTLVVLYCSKEDSDCWERYEGLNYSAPESVKIVSFSVEKTQSTDICEDSDGGMNVYENGRIVRNGKFYDEDSCINFGYDWLEGADSCSGEDCGVAEYYCDKETGEVKFEKKYCPDGCKDGACVLDSTDECFDSDKGGNYYVKGYVEDDSGNKFYDYCNERVAFTGNVVDTIGAKEVETIDKYGQDTIVKGNLVEYLCYVNKEGKEVVSTNNYQCKYGCEDGACVKPVDENIEDFTCESGCIIDGKCYAFGYRKDGQYCTEEKKFIDQKIEKVICENNFECTSNICVAGKCVGQNIFQKFMSWINRFF